MRRWRRKPNDVPDELNELDPFLLSMVDRLASARSEEPPRDGDWVAVEQIAALTERMDARC